ncbi:MAG: integrase core domain-containing protein, partial [Sedimenticolaceae bacterium]
KENSALAVQLMEESVARYRIKPGQLTIHQDRGAPMIAHRFIDQMYELDIILSHSRPRVSNDNAFSESQFKTLKYQPDYPGRFRDAAQARAWAESYFDWYNFSHHHSGLAGFTPAQVFTGDYRDLAAQRQRVLDGYHRANPERFVRGRPAVKLPSQAVYINQVTEEEVAAGATTAVNFPTLNRVKEKNELTLH